MYRERDNKKKDSVFFFCTNDKHHRTTTSIFFSIARFFRLEGTGEVIDEANHLTRCDAKQEVRRFNTVRLGYSTRSYKMYKTSSSNYKQRTVEAK